MSKSIALTLHEGAAAMPVMHGADKLINGAVYTLTVHAVKMARRVVLYPAVNDFAPSGQLRVKTTRVDRPMPTLGMTLHEGAAATPVLRGAGQLKARETYTLTVRAVQVSRGRTVLYPVGDFTKSGRLHVTVTQTAR